MESASQISGVPADPALSSDSRTPFPTPTPPTSPVPQSASHAPEVGEGAIGWVRGPHPILRWVGRVGMALYLFALVVIMGWKLTHDSLQDEIIDKLLLPDEPLILLAAGILGAILFSIGIVNEIGRERIHKGWDVLRQMGPTAILGVLWTVSPGVLGFLLVWYLGPISIWLRGLGTTGWFVYVLLFVFSAGVGFLPTYGQSLLGGWVFGFAWGFPGAMLGFVGGSVIGYFISKRVSKHKVEEILNSNPKARAASDALVGHGFWRTLMIVTLIRIPPNSPFAITNLVLASSGVKFVPYLVGTAIGMAPRTAITCLFAALGAQRGEPSIVSLIRHTPPWVTLVGVAILMAVLYVLYLIAEQAIKAVSGPRAEEAEPPKA